MAIIIISRNVDFCSTVYFYHLTGTNFLSAFNISSEAAPKNADKCQPPFLLMTLEMKADCHKSACTLNTNNAIYHKYSYTASYTSEQ